MIGEETKNHGIFFLAADALIKEATAKVNSMPSEFREYLSTIQGSLPSVKGLKDIEKGKIGVGEASDGTLTETAFGLRCAYLEIYNEQIRDLLQYPPVEVEIREGVGKDAVQLDKLTWHSFASIESLRDLIAHGEQARATSATPLNIHSSRSHTILTIERVKLVVEKSDTLERSVTRIEKVAGQLHLVDLAGSECARLAATTGTNLREGGFINKSLLSLGNVVDAIVENRTHIPYRESKLTRILSNSLGMNKNSRTAIICCINPEPSNLEQSLAGLRFAQRASKVVVHPKVLGTQPPSCILQLINLARQSREDGKALLKQLYAAGAHDSSYLAMRSTKKHMDMITHLFVDECNTVLTQYCESLRSMGVEVAAKREEIRNEIEEIQRHVLHLKTLLEQESEDNRMLCSTLSQNRISLCADEEKKGRLRTLLEEKIDAADLSIRELDAMKTSCSTILEKRRAMLAEANSTCEERRIALEGERVESEKRQLSMFLDAENQRAARKQCDFIDVEKAEVEHKIMTMEEQLRRKKLRREQRRTVFDCLSTQKEKVKELEILIEQRRSELYTLQCKTYGSMATEGLLKEGKCSNFLQAPCASRSVPQNVERRESWNAHQAAIPAELIHGDTLQIENSDAEMEPSLQADRGSANSEPGVGNEAPGKSRPAKVHSVPPMLFSTHVEANLTRHTI